MATAAGAALYPAGTAGGLVLNEDCNHFFSSRAGKRLSRDEVAQFVDQYAGTQVRALFINVNAQRTGYASRVWTPFWEGYRPEEGDGQPLFASQPAGEARKATRAWVHHAWQLHQDGIDPYQEWLQRARKHGIGAWVSVRMNDLHNVEDENHSLHSSFWKQHPKWRRVSYRGEMRDKALDYGRPEVRDYALRLIEELAARYRFDGLELDWMRHGFHFAPGHEAAGAELLGQFHRRVRRILGKRRIAVRVPSRPETAAGLGIDAVAWAREGLVDIVTVTNFWRTADSAMPVYLWRRLLPSRVELAAGLELGCNAFPGSVAAGGRAWQSNSLETVRGLAACYLSQGADRIYLFNYMDSQTAMDENSRYPELLREIGDPVGMSGKPQRHVVTYTDTWAPGEKPNHKLPVEARPGHWISIRQPVGAKAERYRASIRLGVRGGDAAAWAVRCNGTEARFANTENGLRPGPDTPVFRFAAGGPLAGSDAVLEVLPTSGGILEWAEVLLEP